MDNNRIEKENEAWKAYANLEAAFEKAIVCAERNYTDEQNWRLLRHEIEDYFSYTMRFLRNAILNPDNKDNE